MIRFRERGFDGKRLLASPAGQAIPPHPGEASRASFTVIPGSPGRGPGMRRSVRWLRIEGSWAGTRTSSASGDLRWRRGSWWSRNSSRSRFSRSDIRVEGVIALDRYKMRSTRVPAPLFLPPTSHPSVPQAGLCPNPTSTSVRTPFLPTFERAS